MPNSGVRQAYPALAARTIEAGLCRKPKMGPAASLILALGSPFTSMPLA